ncbi:MAG: hypothetical protein M0Q45_06755 [Bacteroidales bacterium]|nr:hypothetical protein [Bacteroidales bacterium]MCK9499188.1 hypothetical protein [Bacteroidales bacterium]MDY0314435.1 hypothetical protein [Bacteroidales bacterium]
MNISQLIALIGSIPLFALRTFFPAFLTALFLSHPEWFPFINSNSEILANQSFWSQNYLVVILGILSILEFISDKNSNLRIFLHEIELYMKPISYLLIQFYVLNQNNTEVINSIQWSGFNPLIIIGVLGSLGVFILAKIRKKTLDWLKSLDFDDNLKIGKLISWLEDSFIAIGFILLIVAGVFMIILYFTIIGILILIRHYYKIKIEKSKLNCPNCKNKIYPFATKCQYCKFEIKNPNKIGLFGNSKVGKSKNILNHQLNLLSQSRCPNCGHYVKKQKNKPICSECQTVFFENPSFTEFLKFQDLKFYKVLAFSFLIGFIPIFGFILSALVTDIVLLSPYKRYLSNINNFFVKLIYRIVFILLIFLGIAFGFIISPLYSGIKYFIVRKKFLKKFNQNHSLLSIFIN